MYQTHFPCGNGVRANVRVSAIVGYPLVVLLEVSTGWVPLVVLLEVFLEGLHGPGYYSL